MKSRKNRGAGRRVAIPPRPFLVLGFLAIAGAGLSAYLTLVHFRHMADPASGSACNFDGWLDCDAVNTSAYSEVFGVPVALLGLLFYGLFAAVAFHAAVRPGRRTAAGGYLRMLSLAGTAASVYLAVVSIAVIRALCLFCAGLYVLNALLMVMAFRMPGKRKGWFRIIDGDIKTLATNRRTLAIAVIGLGFVVGSVILARQVGAGIRSSILDDAGVRLPAGAGKIGAVKGQVYGPRDAAVTVYLFSDFECPFCQKAGSTFDRLVARYKNRARFVYKHFPLDPACNPAAPRGKHENACRAARAAVCAAAEDRFDAFHRSVFENGADRKGIVKAATEVGLDPDELNQCTESLRSSLLVKADVKDGLRIGVRSTPTFVVGDRLLTGSRKFEELAGIVDDALGSLKSNQEGSDRMVSRRRDQVTSHQGKSSTGTELAQSQMRAPGDEYSTPGLTAEGKTRK